MKAIYLSLALAITLTSQFSLAAQTDTEHCEMTSERDLRVNSKADLKDSNKELPKTKTSAK